jgi:UDP-N-acetylglucosamine 2-epimerase (non-hydrolysing)
VLVVLGTRPEAVKLAPVVRALRADHGPRVRVCATAQHREMLDQTLADVGLRVDFDLDLMRPRQDLNSLTARALAELGPLIRRERPRVVVVQGDTTTALAGALAAFHERVPVAHVEAGLRTGDPDNPFPEELNRVLIDELSVLRFAPTAAAARNLLRGRRGQKTFVVGNTGLDSLRRALDHDFPIHEPALRRALASISEGDRVIFATAHRRESFGPTIRGLYRALARLVAARPGLHALIPVHMNPEVRAAARPLSVVPRVHLLPPLGYLDGARALSRADLVMTDSGGLQEESAFLGKPALVLRRVTERPEGVAAGVALIAGVEEQKVYALASRVLDDAALYRRMARPVKVYGDGRSSERVAREIRSRFDL